MTKEQLKELGLTDEVVEKIVKDYEDNYIDKTKGDYIPKSRLDEVIGERDTYKGQVAERDTQLNKLKKEIEDGDITKLNDTIIKLQQDNKTAAENYAKELKQIKTDNYIDKMLTQAEAKNSVAVKALLAEFLSKNELGEDGTIKGLDAEIERLKTAEDSCFMFGKTAAGTSNLQGKTPDDPANKGGAVDTSKMTYSQMMDYLEKNPNAKI